MNYKNLKINEKELSKIKMAEEEIKNICDKYNVYIQGSCDTYDSEYDTPYTLFTKEFSVESKDYEDRVSESDKAYELQHMYKQQESLRRFLEKHKAQYPNHLNLSVFKKSFTEPKGWTRDSLFIKGLKVRDWEQIKEPLFWLNPNGHWQYGKSFKNNEIRADVSMWIYPKIDTPTLYSHQGNINCKLYEGYKDKTDALSHSFLIQMIDELLELGILEIV